MKANKLLKTLAASAMSLALMAGVTVMPAMAADPENTASSVTVYKTIDMTNADGAGVPNTKFTFTAQAMNPTGSAGVESNAKEGILEAITNRTEITADFTGVTSAFSQGEGATLRVFASAEIKLEFDTTKFTNTGAGVYYYNLTENPSTVNGITVDDNTYVLKVYVGYAGDATTLSVLDAAMYAQGAETTKVDSISNAYDTRTLTVTKQVEGAMGDKSKEFTFTIQVDDPNYVAAVEGTGAVTPMRTISYSVDGGKTRQNVDLKDGTCTIENVKLKDDQSVVVYGLPNGATYTITESDNSEYTVTYAGDASAVEGNASQATGTMSTADATVTVTNTRNTVTPTGIIMNIAPYALMVVIAVAGVAVFMRKRVEE